jgi:hypothetical protein
VASAELAHARRPPKQRRALAGVVWRGHEIDYVKQSVSVGEYADVGRERENGADSKNAGA